MNTVTIFISYPYLDQLYYNCSLFLCCSALRNDSELSAKRNVRMVGFGARVYLIFWFLFLVVRCSMGIVLYFLENIVLDMDSFFFSVGSVWIVLNGRF